VPVGPRQGQLGKGSPLPTIFFWFLFPWKKTLFFPAAIHFFFVLFFSSLFDQLALKKSLFDQQTFTSS